MAEIDHEILGIGQDTPGSQGAAVGQLVGGEFRHIHHVELDRPHLSIRPDVKTGDHIPRGNAV